MGQKAGAVYMYTLNDGQIKFEAKITASDGGENQMFGHSVSVYENKVDYYHPSVLPFHLHYRYFLLPYRL